MNSSKNEEEILPDGWVLCQSKSNNGRKYYFNKKTGKSSWTRPEAEERPYREDKKAKIEKECKAVKRPIEEDKRCMKRKTDSCEDLSPKKKVVRVSDAQTPNCSKTKIQTSTPTTNSANKRLALLRNRLSDEVQNEDSSSSSSRSSAKPRNDTISPKKMNNDIQNRNSKANTDYTSPCNNDSKCSTSQSPSSDSIPSVPSPSQFFTANKILCSMKSQLHEDVNSTKRDTFAEIEAGICSQTPDYSSMKHPATPPQFSEASKLVSAIKSKLAYRSNASKEISEIQLYSSANDRLAALRKSLSISEDGVEDENFASKLIASVKRKYSVEAMEVDETKTGVKGTRAKRAVVDSTHETEQLLIYKFSWKRKKKTDSPYILCQSADDGAPVPPHKMQSSKAMNNILENVVLVVDTNIFIHELDFIKIVLSSHIKGYREQPMLIVPWRVINELDRLKDNNNGNSAICKRAKAAMDYLYQSLPENNRIKGQSLRDANSHIYPCELPDDEILNCCLQQAERGKSVILLTNDKNLCNKATINSVKSISLQDLKSQLEHRPPTSASPELSDNLRHYEDCIYQLLSNILENEMRAKYNTLWQHVLFKAPPWTLRDVLHCLLKHWIAVFSEVFPRIEHLITELKNTLVRIEEKGRKSLTQIDVTTFKDLSLEIAKRCQIIPEYMDLAKVTVEKINKASEQSTSHDPSRDTEKSEKAKELCIVQAFENVWTVFSSYCAKLASGLGITHNVDDNILDSEPQSVLIEKWVPFSNQIHEFSDAIRGILGIEKESDPSLAEHIGRLECVFKVSLKLISADETIVTAESLLLFATKCRNMLREACDKFAQLTELLDVCGSMLNQV